VELKVVVSDKFLVIYNQSGVIIIFFFSASSEEGLEMCGLNSSGQQSNSKPPTSRNNTALHVCWHRGVTVSLEDQIEASQVIFISIF
jgi:hypothetical protein